MGFARLQIAFTIGISSATVGSYLELYQQFKHSEASSSAWPSSKPSAKPITRAG